MHPWNQPILDALKKRERLPHAILLHGPRGVGKLALAERMAQLLLCEHAEPAKRPCGTCDGCRWYLSGNHPDFRRLEPEAIAKLPPPAEEEEGSSEAAPARRTKQPSLVITVDQVRGLADFLNVGSHRGKLRIALIHPADDLQLPSAANALLKGLEEPPSGAIFILVSHRPARLERWLAFAGGAPVQALEYATEAAGWERLLKSPTAVENREDLERLAEALQKIAYDRAFSAFGLPPKYRTGAPASRAKARAWLTYARNMGENRLLTRHPLNPRLFSAEMLVEMEKASS